eukprot:2744947-Prymnesium_polylepis.1
MVRRKAVLERYAALRCRWHVGVGKIPAGIRTPDLFAVCRRILTTTLVTGFEIDRLHIARGQHIIFPLLDS